MTFLLSGLCLFRRDVGNIFPAECDRLLLLPGINLGVIGPENRIRQRRSYDGIAVTAKQHDRGGWAKRLCQCCAQSRGADQQIGVRSDGPSVENWRAKR